MVQAMFPVGSRVIPNPEGTAPGIELDLDMGGRTSHMFALPGVPAEMRQMWEQSVAPALMALGAGGEVIRHRRIKCFGVGESDLEQMLPDSDPPRPLAAGRHHRSRGNDHAADHGLGATPDACYAAMEPTVDTIRQCLGKLVFGEEDDELEHAVVRLLGQHQRTLATCEWGTAGLVADWLGRTWSE